MKKLEDIINEGYWGCKPLENDYVLDRQSELYQSFLRQAFNKIKFSDNYEELYFNIAIALDLLERLQGSEGCMAFTHRNQIQDKIIKCLDKVYDGYKDTWNNTAPETWENCINDLKKKTLKLFKVK